MHLGGTPSQKIGTSPPSCLLLENRLYILMSSPTFKPWIWFFVQHLINTQGAHVVPGAMVGDHWFICLFCYLHEFPVFLVGQLHALFKLQQKFIAWTIRKIQITDCLNLMIDSRELEIIKHELNKSGRVCTAIFSASVEHGKKLGYSSKSKLLNCS